ncbi:MAG: hypothetical protein GKS05_09335 [Nitrospirales bacterium]|nr:hypothetical protein [Nitrospirales bacterium]
MRSAKHIIGVRVLLLGICIVFGAVTAQAENYHVKWKQILGVVVPGSTSGGHNVVGGVQSTGVSWATTRGKAKVNLDTGRVMFEVEGLVLIAAPPPAVLGVPSPLVTMVKGTVVCNSTGVADLVDTAAVPLSAQGEAEFHGTVALPPVCEKIAFLIRVADANFLVDRWIAHGVVRKP